jgi:hypothetical protein
VLSLVLLLKQAVGLVPQLDLVMLLARALGYQTPAAAWAAHCVIGVIVWGTVFPWFDRKTFFSHWINGIFFASVVWLGVMLVIMPLAGMGLFGLAIGIATPTLTLFLHWIYGVVLGGAYGALGSATWARAVHRLSHA